MTAFRVRVDALQSGDYLPDTYRTVISVWRGLDTPRGKSEVYLSDRDGAELPVVRWNSRTIIGIDRKEKP